MIEWFWLIPAFGYGAAFGLWLAVYIVSNPPREGKPPR